jgi:hypothetical protein
MNSMRQKATDEKKSFKKQILDQHPWYNELINKVVVLNGVQRVVTPHEQIILDHIKKYMILTQIGGRPSSIHQIHLLGTHSLTSHKGIPER